MNKKIAVSIFLVAIAVVVFVVADNSGRVNSAHQDAITLGAALDLTGFAASWGEEERNAIMLAVEEWNARGGIDGVSVELIVEDAKGENPGSVTAFKKLIEIDDVNAIIGNTWFDSFPAAAPLSDSSDIVVMTPSGSIAGLKSIASYPNAFSSWYRADFEHYALAGYLAEEGIEKIAVLNSNDTFCIDGARHLERGAKEQGVTIVENFVVNPSTDIRTEIAKINAAEPDAVYLCLYEVNLLSFLKQKRELGLNTLLVSTEYIEEFAYRPDLVELFEELKFVAPNITESEFVRRYEERYGARPIYSASNAYDAANILLEAMDAVGTETDAIREYILGNTFDTATFGEVDFDEIGGVTKSDFVIKEFVDGSVELVTEL